MRWGIFVVALFCGYVNSAVPATITSVTPSHGSWAGGTSVYIHGTGLVDDVYGTPLSVWIGDIPCDVEWMETSSTVIHCITRPFPRNLVSAEQDPFFTYGGAARLAVWIKIDGNPYNCGDTAATACYFTYSVAHTPTLTGVSPPSISPLSQPQIKADTLTTGDATEILSSELGGHTCSIRLNTASAEGEPVSLLPATSAIDTGAPTPAVGEAYPVIGTAEDAYWCQVMETFPGYYNVTYKTALGNSYPLPESLRVNGDQELYSAAVIPRIATVAPAELPSAGGRMITLQGGGFADPAVAASVEIGGQECVISSQTVSQVMCISPPISGTAPAATHPYWKGPRGSSKLAFTTNTYVSMSAFTSSAEYPGAPDSKEITSALEGTADAGIVRAIFTAPFTGTYVFYVAGGGEAELFLGTDTTAASKASIATSPGAAHPYWWYKHLSQISSSVSMTKGDQRYIELVHTGGPASVAFRIKETSYGRAQTWQAINDWQRVEVSSNYVAEVQRLLVADGASSNFNLVWQGRTGVSISPTVTAGEITAAIDDMISWQCTQVGDGALYDTDSFESANEWSTYSFKEGRAVVTSVTDTAFCGRKSLYIESGYARNFEGATVEDGQSTTGYDVLTYTHMCMAYKLPLDTKVNMLVDIDGLGWRSISLTGVPGLPEEEYHYPVVATWNTAESPLIADNAWHHTCIDLKAQLEANLGSAEHTILSVLFHPPDWTDLDNYGGEMWIDEFAIVRGSVSVSQSTTPLHPNGIWVKEVAVTTLGSPPAGYSAAFDIEFRMDPNYCASAGSSYPLMTTSDSAIATVIQHSLSTPSLHGQFTLTYNGVQSSPISMWASDSEIKAAVASIDGAGLIHASSSTSNCYSRQIDITFLSGGDRPQVSIDHGAVTGDTVSSSVTTLLEGGLMFGPIPADFLESLSDAPIITMSVQSNGKSHVASCDSCTPTIAGSFDGVAVDSVSPLEGKSGSEINLYGSGFAAGAVVTVGNVACEITSISSNHIVCTTSATQPVGIHLVRVTNLDGGVNLNAPTFTTTLSLTTISHSTGSLSGGLPLTINGVDFGYGIEPSDATVTVGGYPCEVTQVSYIRVVCTTAAVAEGHNESPSDIYVNIAGGYGTLVGAFTYTSAVTPSVTAISPASGLATGGVPVTLSGSFFDRSKGYYAVKLGEKTCEVTSATPTELICTTSTMDAGVPALVSVNVLDIGLASASPADLSYTGVLEITGISQQEGSLYGGNIITIHGNGFVGDSTTVSVGNAGCNVVSMTETEIVCETEAGGKIHQITNDASNGAYGLGYAFTPAVLNVAAGDRVQWTWTSSRYSNVSHQIMQTDAAGVNVDLGFFGKMGGQGQFMRPFAGEGTFYYVSDRYRDIGMMGTIVVGPPSSTGEVGPVSVTIGGVEASHNLGAAQTFSSCIPAPVDSSKFNYGSGVCTSPRVSSFSPTTGRQNTLITIDGEGFTGSSDTTVVTLRRKRPDGTSILAPCTQTSSTTTRIVCRIDAPVTLGEHHITVSVDPYGWAGIIQGPPSGDNTFHVVPHISSMSHTAGSVAGGHILTIHGDGLRPSNHGLLHAKIGDSPCIQRDFEPSTGAWFTCETVAPYNDGYAKTVDADSPVGYWKMEAGSLWTHEPNYGSAGSTGDASRGSGIPTYYGIGGNNGVDRAYHFNSIGEASLPMTVAGDLMTENLASSFSLELWANVTEEAEPDTDDLRIPLSHINVANGWECVSDCKSSGVMVAIHCGRWELWVSKGESSSTVPATDPSDCSLVSGSGAVTRSYPDVSSVPWVGVWDVLVGPQVSYGTYQHVVGTYDSTTNTITLYIDGVAVLSHVVVGGTYTPAPKDSGMYLGGLIVLNSLTGLTNYVSLFHGSLDEIAAYDKLLSASQVADHWTYGSADAQVVTVSYEEYEFVPSGTAQRTVWSEQDGGSVFIGEASEVTPPVSIAGQTFNQPVEGEFVSFSTPVTCDYGGSTCQYEYNQAYSPILNGLWPSPIQGGETLNMYGKSLGDEPLSDIEVTVGGIVCPDVVIVNNDALTCTMPSSHAGDFDVIIRHKSRGMVAHAAGGDADYSRARTKFAFPDGGAVYARHRYIVTSISPSVGSVNGGLRVTMEGVGFSATASDNFVYLGGVACEIDEEKMTTNSLECITGYHGPMASPEAVHMVVATAGFHQDSGAATFQYREDATPVLTFTGATHGSGETLVLPGSMLDNASGSTGSVTVSLEQTGTDNKIIAYDCPVTASSATSVSCTVPQQPAGAYRVVANVPGRGRTGEWYYLTHHVSLALSSAVTHGYGGGMEIEVTGSGLSSTAEDLGDAAQATFAGDLVLEVCGTSASCIDVKDRSYTGLKCTTGPLNDAVAAASTASDITGAADRTCDMKITVTRSGFSTTLSNVAVYQAASTAVVTSVSPNQGGTAGGVEITIAGENFGASGTVKVADADCVVKSFANNEVVCVTGATDMTGKFSPVVVNTNGNSVSVPSTSDTILFEYVAPWSSPYTWGGNAPPVEGETVHIPKGLHVLLDISPPVLHTMIIEGTLEFARQDLTLEAHVILVNGGHLIVGTENEPFLQNAIIKLHGNVKDPELPVLGNKCIGNRNGIVDLHGRPRLSTWTQLSQDALVGTNSIKVVTPAEGLDWEVHEIIVVAPTGRLPYESEERTITAIVDNSDGTHTINLNAPLLFNHDGTIATYGGKELDMRAEVGLLTRNVKVMGYIPDGINLASSPGEDRFGSQIMMWSEAVGRLSYIEVTRGGQPFRLGRYPIHFHHTHNGHPSYVKGCSIHHTFNRAITTHQTIGSLIENNVAFFIEGHAFFLEDGGETDNTYRNNLGIFIIPSAAMLNTDQLPAVFWCTNPSNNYINNRAVGSVSHGFWIKLNPKPDGALNADICPEGAPLGEFRNNVGHTNQGFGFRVWEKYLPVEDPKGCTGAQVTGYEFQDMQMYGNEKGVEFTVLGEVHVHNVIMADNRDTNLEITEPTGRWGGPLFSDMVLVGKTNSVAMANDPPSHTGLRTPNQNKLEVRDMAFINFNNDADPTQPTAAIRGCSQCKLLQGGQITRFKGLTFENSPNVIAWQWEHEALYYDIDGTLTGQAGGWALPTNGMLPTDTCSMVSGMSVGAYNGSVCASSMTFRRVSWNKQLPLTLEGEDVKITAASTGLSTVVPWRHYRLTHTDGYMVTVYTGETYDMSWNLEGGTRVDPLGFAAGAYELQNDDWFIWRLSFQQAPDHWHINDITTPQSVPIDNNIHSHGDWYFDEAQLQVSILVSGRGSTPHAALNGAAPGGVGRDIEYVLHVCPDEGCPTDLPPALGEFAGTIKYWCDPTSWPSGSVPVAGEDVEIPLDVRMVVNCDTASLGRVTVDGMIEIADDGDYSFTATHIFLRGGYFVAGTEEAPHQHKATIQLTGNRNTAEWALDNVQNMGAKAIGVYGQLSLVGKPRAVSWAHLAATANAGDVQITVDKDVSADWEAGDQIIITSSTYESHEATVRTITSVSGTGTITVDSALTHAHTVGAPGSASESFKVEVGLLTRNVEVVGLDVPSHSVNVDQFGARILVGSVVLRSDNQGTSKLYRGIANLRDVRIGHHGQRGWFHPADPRYGISFLDIGAYGQFSSVRNCAFHDGYSNGIGVFGTSKVVIEDNVVYGTIGSGIRSSGHEVQIRRNLVALQQVHLQDVDDTHWIGDQSASFEISGKDSVIIGNAAGGSERSGFRITGEYCGNNLIQGNTAHSNSLGIRVDGVGDGTSCTTIQDFITWKNYNFGIWSHTRSSLEVHRVTVGDSRVGLNLNVFGPDILLHLTVAKSVKVFDSKIIGTTDEEAADCGSIYLPSNPEFESFDMSEKKMGVMFGLFTREKLGRAPYHKVQDYPALYGGTVLNNVEFINFGSNSCGRARDFCISNNPIGPDAQHPITLIGSSTTNVETPSSLAYLHEPDPEWINPFDCADMDCDGPKHSLIRDETGTFLGQVGSVLPKAEVRFDEAKVPAEVYTQKDGTILPIEDVVIHQGIVRRNMDNTGSCTFNTDMNAHLCSSMNHRMLVFESMDFDTETRRLSPVALSSNGHTDLLNGPMDHGWCAYYQCLRRVSAFFGVVAVGNEYQFHLTNTEPQHARMHLLDATSDEEIRLSYSVTRPERVDVYVGGKYIEPTNAAFLLPSTDAGAVERRWDPSYAPNVNTGKSSGTNYYDPDTGFLHIIVKGSQPIDIVRSSVIQVALSLAVGVENFYENDLVQNLAFLLGIDVSRIRIVDVVPGSSQSSSSVLNLRGMTMMSAATSELTNVNVAIGAPPADTIATPATTDSAASGTTDESGFDQGNSEHEASKDVYKQQVDEYNHRVEELEELNNVGATLTEKVQLGELKYPVKMMEMSTPPAAAKPAVPLELEEGEAESLAQPKEYEPPANSDPAGSPQKFQIPAGIRPPKMKDGSTGKPRGVQGEALPAFQVSISDVDGELVENLGFAGTVWHATAQLEQTGMRAMSTNGADLSGTTTVTFVDGYATFDDLKISSAGSYNLVLTTNPGNYQTTQAVEVEESAATSEDSADGSSSGFNNWWFIVASSASLIAATCLAGVCVCAAVCAVSIPSILRIVNARRVKSPLNTRAAGYRIARRMSSVAEELDRPDHKESPAVYTVDSPGASSSEDNSPLDATFTRADAQRFDAVVNNIVNTIGDAALRGVSKKMRSTSDDYEKIVMERRKSVERLSESDEDPVEDMGSPSPTGQSRSLSDNVPASSSRKRIQPEPIKEEKEVQEEHREEPKLIDLAGPDDAPVGNSRRSRRQAGADVDDEDTGVAQRTQRRGSTLNPVVAPRRQSVVTPEQDMAALKVLESVMKKDNL